MGEQTSGKVPGPAGRDAAPVLAGLIRDPLGTYLRLVGRYGDAVRVPLAPNRAFYLLSRPEHAEHVLASGQDGYVKAFTYRPLRALVGNGLLTSEGEVWRRHRRLIQPVFSRRDVLGFGPHMTVAARRLVQRWDRLPDGAMVDAAQEISALSLEIAGRALFGADLTGDAEALRLYPPAWTIERDAARGNDAAGVPIPARSTVAISPYLTHRHPEFWPNPAGFDPGRFLPGGHGDPATRHRYAYIPFGGGRRACIGSAFAELEVTLVLATIMRRYQPELTASGMPQPLAQVTLRPGRRLPMRLRRR